MRLLHGGVEMGQVIFFPNMKDLDQRANATGTAVTAADATVHACLDVFARNDASNPLYTSAASTLNILDQDIHDAAGAPINGSAGAYIAFGTAITIPAGTELVQISSTLGEPVEIAFGADATAAATSAKKVYLVPGGSPGKLEFIPATENKAFIRSLSTTAISDGYVTLNFLG